MKKCQEVKIQIKNINKSVNGKLESKNEFWQLNKNKNELLISEIRWYRDTAVISL